MLGTDGKDLRQRAVSQPVSQPGVYQEESILKRRVKMAEEGRTPLNMGEDIRRAPSWVPRRLTKTQTVNHRSLWMMIY